jgi:ABC-2 type transport system permease protein
MLFLGGIFFPLNIMPDFLTFIAKASPSTHLNDVLRLVVIEDASLGLDNLWTYMFSGTV